MPPCANSAQAMRAILLASATATTLKGRLAKSCVSQGYFSGFSLARRNTEWAPTMRMRRKILVTLFGDRPQLLLAASRVLSRHQPDPSREITP